MEDVVVRQWSHSASARDWPSTAPCPLFFPEAIVLRYLLLGIALGAVVAALLALLHLQIWKARYTRMLRLDAVQRSQAVTIGKVSEQLVPYFPDFRWNPKDARFLGTPVDFVVFDGLSDGAVRSIVFVEVKTAGSRLTDRQRQVRDAILTRAVAWEELRLAADG